MKSPAFQFYPTDYLGSQRVQMMTLEEEGAYCRLLWSCWQHGSIPADPELAARLIGKGCSTTVARVVLPMFEIACGEGRLTHDRLERERAKQADWREKSAAGGRKSAEKRKGGARVVQPPYQPKGNTPSSVSCLQSPSSVSDSEIPYPTPHPADPPARKRRAAAKRLECAAFTEFWKQYPRREAIGDAEAAWVKHGCAAILPQILTAIRTAKSSAKWTKEAGQFIPHPATWLNRRGWEDEMSAATAPMTEADKAREAHKARCYPEKIYVKITKASELPPQPALPHDDRIPNF